MRAQTEINRQKAELLQQKNDAEAMRIHLQT